MKKKIQNFIYGAWKWRWPGGPLALTILITVVNFFYQSDTLDSVMVILIAASLILLIASIAILTPRDRWSERNTGILLFAFGDLMLYGFLILPPRLGYKTPFPKLSTGLLRGSLLVAPILLIISYSDLNWNRMQRWYRGRKDRKLPPYQ
jgi:hypothetical protein